MNRARFLPVQLLLFTILPLTALLIGVAYAGLTLHQRAMRQMVGERDERAVRAAAAAIEEQLAQRLAAVESLALHVAHVPPAADHIWEPTVDRTAPLDLDGIATVCDPDAAPHVADDDTAGSEPGRVALAR